MSGLGRRLFQYQRERFPLVRFAPMIAVFTFSAAAYARLARGAEGFIPLPRYAMGAATALALFFLLRVLDEHKDAAVDRRYRPELPVPRGLVTHAELRGAGGAVLLAVLLWNAVAAPVLLWPLALVLAWAALMTAEFFAPAWLRARPAAYLLTHMAILPLIDGYTTGLDWLVDRGAPPPGLVWFLLVTFLNGIVIELGRKLRAPGDEREGVDTYTAAWGTRRAAGAWMAVLVLTAATALGTLRFVSTAPALFAAIGVAAAAGLVPALRFVRVPTREDARRIETTSGVWTLLMYLVLGAGPFVLR